MDDKSSAFGMNPDQINKLLSWPLGNDVEGTPTVSLEPFAEGPGGQIGRYKLLRVLGEGGMGIVYLAEQMQPVRREVALKIIKPGMDSKRVLARFETEEQALAIMEHPHIARVYDAGLAPSGRPYFVMEHVKGIPITEHCDRYNLSIENRLQLFLHVCEAIQHAHQKGIIHRDLKPSNILVVVQDDEAIPKVIDFGVARAISQPLTERTLCTEQGQLIGTPEYMSPEQADLNNQDLDTRTDIYSLGIVLYELLAGVLPFDAETFRTGGIEHIRQVICQEDPKTPSTRLNKTSANESVESARRRRTDPRTLQRKLRGDLDWIALRALEKDRTRRYATVEALAVDIQNHLTHQPVAAAPPALRYRAGKFARRHRQALAALAMMVLVLAGVLLAVWTSVRTVREHAYVESLVHRRSLADAHMLIGNQKYDEAVTKIEPLLRSKYVGRQARLAHAQIRLEQKDFAAAITELEDLVGEPSGHDETTGQAHAMLANIYYEGDPCAPGQPGDYHQLWKEHREQAEELIGNTAVYQFLRARATPNVQEALTLLARALELDRQHYDSLRERAYIYQGQHDCYDMAMDAACMITIQPRNPQGYDLKAVALREMGRPQEALPNHNAAIELSPDDPDLYEERRETYLRMQQYELALQDAQKCAQLRPNEPSYFYKPFLVYTAMGQYDQAAEHFARFMASPAASRGYDPDNLPNNTSLYFHLFSSRHVFESLRAGRPWHGSSPPPHSAPYAVANEADSSYRWWSREARSIISTGFDPSWSPDGTKLAYSQGLHTGSVVAVFDLTSGRIQLLISPGRSPAWSPDGRYVAFVKDRWLLPPKQLGHLNCLDWIMDGETPRHAEEVWVVDMVNRQVHRIGAGTNPHWGGRSRRLYFYDAADNTLYSISVEDRTSRPLSILTDCGSPRPRVSPDERYVADCKVRELRIVDLTSKEVIASWTAPPVCRDALLAQWSPDGSEISIGSFIASEMGLWIYDLRTRTAAKLLPGQVATACWSPDRRYLAACLGPPFVQVWLADVTPDRPTTESFDSVQTFQEHSHWLIEKLNREIEADPALIYAYDQRADCGLWTGDEKASEYLDEFDRVLTTYSAEACASRAKRILDWPPQQRDRLLPMAALLARKAAAKEPETADYRTLVHRVLERQP